MSKYHDNALAPASRRIDLPIVQNRAEDRFMELIEREQLPGDVRSNLAGALTGDLARQNLLFQAMIDTWPRLSKNIAEVADAVKGAKWQWTPFKARGEDESSKEAVARSEFIEDIWNEAKGVSVREVVRNEKSSDDIIKNLCFGYYLGHHVVETLWKNEGGNIQPRAFKSIPARFYGYPYYDEPDDRLMFNPSGGMNQEYIDFPDHHFMIGMNSAHPGHPTVAAPLRALTGYWLAANFGLKWLLSFAQLYGIPFRWAEYEDEKVKDKVCGMLKNIGSAGWGAFPKGTKINFNDASKAANSLPQAGLIEMADEQCDIFILGQTLTSSQGEKGSQALGNVHNEVRQGVFAKVADFVKVIINGQLVESIAELNFGNTENLPCIKPVFEKKEDPQKLVERDKYLIVDLGLEVSKEWLYERHGVPIPKQGEIFIPTNPNGVQGDPATGLHIPIETKDKVESRNANLTWNQFDKDSGTLGIPRAEMPQIYSGNRAALVNFLKKRGINSVKETVNADELLPTQLDYSPEKVQKSVEFVGGNRSILVSSDNHVVDGHHQWIGSLEKGEEISILRLGAPITRLLNLAHQMPSTTVTAAQAQAEPDALDRFVDKALEELTGVTREWLAPVRPLFERLAALAMSKHVTDDDFIKALEDAQRTMPELFDKLDTNALQDAFENSIGTAMLNGSVSRYEPDKLEAAFNPNQKRAANGQWVKEDGSMDLKDDLKIKYRKLNNDVIKIGKDKFKPLDEIPFEQRRSIAIQEAQKAIEGDDPLSAGWEYGNIFNNYGGRNERWHASEEMRNKLFDERKTFQEVGKLKHQLQKEKDNEYWDDLFGKSAQEVSKEVQLTTSPYMFKYGLSAKNIVYRKESKPPNVLEILDTDLGDVSRVSKSKYPIIEVKLSNGSSIYKKIRISDHGQVSSRAPRTYEYDYREDSLKDAINTGEIIDDMRREAEATWDEQREILK